MTVPFTALNTGAHLPLLGLGTWQSKDENELTVALKAALDGGYRLIDTAFIYQNEKIIGNVLHEYLSSGKIKREELFITTKLPFSAHKPSDVPKMVEQQLKDLQLDYIDLYLIHCPCGFEPQADNFMPLLKDGEFVPVEVTHLETWRAMEALYKEGKLKALGVSNFNGQQLEDLHKQAEIKPTNLQVECHIYWPQFELHELCKKLNVSFTAYGPLGSPGRKAIRPDGVWPEGDPLTEEIVKKIAANHHKTAAQSKNEDELTIALKAALDCGYRLIDTAFIYENEKIIGKVLKEYVSSGKIKREDLFVTSKLPYFGHNPSDVPKCVEKQLKDLQLDYIDLYLIHYPCAYECHIDNFAPLVEDCQFVPRDVSHLDTWRALEDLVKEGKLKTLGVSNFNAHQLQTLYKQAEIKPTNLQVECHIYWPHYELHELCKNLNMTFTAYAPLGSPGRKIY